MNDRLFKQVRGLSALLCLGSVLVVVGCSKGPGKLVPVSGKVSFNGKPLTAGSVTFVADIKKGNTSKYNPVGQIGSDGTYELKTNGASGAPLGAYKVTVTNFDFKEMVENKKKPDVQLPPVYQSPETTPVSKEVVESSASGAYDIELK